MEEQIKNIVSKYIKIPAEQITAHTVIDRSAVASSIILHRMYAQLANAGFAINDYTVIKTFGQLTTGGTEREVSITDPSVINENTNEPSIGIDTENINSMPVVNDFRAEAFYTMNFAPAEIAYCILQTNPYASFAGLFAAKEAIIKADNSFQNKPFHTIIIDHLPGGKPVYTGFQISISHTNQTAIAVAVKNISSASSPLSAVNNTGGNSTLITSAAVAAFLLSLLTLVLFIVKSC